MSRKILIFAGSTRAHSLHRKIALEATELLRTLGADVTFADLRDYPMPLYDGDFEEAHGLPPNAKAFKELLRAHDVLVIASPEYNGSFSAVLKNAIDWSSRPEPGEAHLAVFRGKVAAIMSASPGPGGGRRGLKHLRELLEMIGVRVVPTQLEVVRSSQAFDAGGKLLRPEDVRTMQELADSLVSVGAAQSA